MYALVRFTLQPYYSEYRQKSVVDVRLERNTFRVGQTDRQIEVRAAARNVLYGTTAYQDRHNNKCLYKP